MKIWYDALTGKHMRYAIAIAQRLRKTGNEVVITTRRHPDTLPLAEFLDEKVTVVGRYNPRTLLTRLREGTRRQLQFCRIFQDTSLDVAVSHGSTDMCRVAFGLGKPIITTADTPYADAVHRLTLPLSSYIVASEAIPKDTWKNYNPKAEITTFSGVDEIAWIRDFKPRIRYDYGKPLIVVREFEQKATYATQKVNLFTLAKKLTQLGKVIFLSRYQRKTVKGMITTKGFVDSASLVAQADLFIGAGGTITREAALQGTPAIIVKTPLVQHVNDFLIDKGFPICKTPPEALFKLAKKALGKKCDVKPMLKDLENPVDTIAKLLRNQKRWNNTA